MPRIFYSSSRSRIVHPGARASVPRATRRNGVSVSHRCQNAVMVMVTDAISLAQLYYVGESEPRGSPH